MTLHLEPSSWHPGETALHNLLHIPHRNNPTAAGLPNNYAYRVAASPLVAFGALDPEGRPWTTVWGGEVGFARPFAHGVLSASSLVDTHYDPVVKSLFAFPDGSNRSDEYQITRTELESGGGKLMAGLSIDLATRDRVKIAGRMVAGKVGVADGEDTGDTDDRVARVQMAMLVEESLGNCPKYLNKKDIRAHMPSPRLISEALPLPSEAVALLGKADLFFLSSTDGKSMDTNHRGGPPGFVRLMSNSKEDGVNLIYPEYSGNRLYQTLGNLYVRPLVGICIPDFETSDVLYLTGETKILIGADAARILPHTKLAVKIHVTAARFVKDGLSFHGDIVDHSPYNPPVRRLTTETTTGDGSIDPDTKPPATATLINREIIAPTVARFTFKLETSRPLKKWAPGQHVTFDFSPELDVGWSHMRDDDPTSLNDDFVRTFTISNLPPSGGGDEVEDGTELQITARRHGPATGLLWTHNLRTPLELPLMALGGEASFRMANAGGNLETVFVAGGVGITPLLAQAPGLIESGKTFKVLWSLRGSDLPVAVDVLETIRGLAERTTIFVTGGAVGEEEPLEALRKLGSKVVIGRMALEDVTRPETGKKRKYYLCTGSEMLKVLLEWLNGEDVCSETFSY